MKHDALRSPLARVRGLGSAKDGFHHWWLQRLTAIALVPLSIWFMAQLMGSLIGATRFDVAGWLESPLAALLLLALLVALLTHAKLGIQVVLEDYVHTEWKKIALLLINQYAFIALGAAGVFAVIKLHFFGI